MKKILKASLLTSCVFIFKSLKKFDNEFSVFYVFFINWNMLLYVCVHGFMHFLIFT